MIIRLSDKTWKKMHLLYPTMEIDKLTFHVGEMPWYIRNHAAVVIGNHIYFRNDLTERLLAHELCHVRQGAAGFGVWLLRPFYLRYLWEWIRAGFSYKKNSLEVEARSMEKLIS